MRIVYNKDGTKTITDRKPPKSLEIDDRKPFAERIKRSYYELECNGELTPGTNKNWVKRTWDRDLQRHEAGLD